MDAASGPARHAVTLLEVLIVIAIIGILASLLLPAIHAARQAAQRASCDNNLRQLDLALRTYIEMHQGLSPPPRDDRTGGWALAVLPFIEEQPLWELFDPNQPITCRQNLAAAAHRPPLFFCPATPEIDSTIDGVGVTNYLLVVDRPTWPVGWRSLGWSLKEAPAESRYPWCTSPELTSAKAGYPPPHPSAFRLGP